MRLRDGICALIACAVLAGSAGCYEVSYKRQDQRNIREQFHLPRDASFAYFDSNPKTAGFFGREGLTISAAVQFTEASFSRYVREMNDPETWKGVPFRGYSPDRAESYSEAALQWRELPVPDIVRAFYRHWDLADDAERVEQGKYYCSTIVMSRGEPLANNPSAYHWNNLGRACEELAEGHSPVVRVLGVLDFEQKRLFVRIAFSG